jgi:hypothetical protein
MGLRPGENISVPMKYTGAQIATSIRSAFPPQCGIDTAFRPAHGNPLM